jgi:hypothetical protein
VIDSRRAKVFLGWHGNVDDMGCRELVIAIVLFLLCIGTIESAQWAGAGPNLDRSPMNSSETKRYNQSATTSQNYSPSIISFDPSLDSPQQIGMPIGWRVTASDPDNDNIYYRFWLNGPRTGGKWQIMQDWSSTNVWYWRTDGNDAGSSDVRVWIRDGKHADADGMDTSEEYIGYQIASESADLNIEVTSDVYSDKDRNVYYCPKGNIMVVKNRIFLIGSDIDKVKQVRYFLHESFNQPEGMLADPNNSFEIWIWTWGGFPIKAVITTKTGQQIEKHYLFNFKSKFEESQKNGIPLVETCKE